MQAFAGRAGPCPCWATPLNSPLSKISLQSKEMESDSTSYASEPIAFEADDPPAQQPQLPGQNRAVVESPFPVAFQAFQKNLRNKFGWPSRKTKIQAAIRVAVFTLFMTSCEAAAQVSGVRAKPTGLSTAKEIGFLASAIAINKSTYMPSPRIFAFFISKRYGTKLRYQDLAKFLFLAFLTGLVVALLYCFPRLFTKDFKKEVQTFREVGASFLVPLFFVVSFGALICTAASTLFTNGYAQPNSIRIAMLIRYLDEMTRFTYHYMMQVKEVPSKALPRREFVYYFLAQAKTSLTRAVFNLLRDAFVALIQVSTGLPQEVTMLIDVGLGFVNALSLVQHPAFILIKHYLPNREELMSQAHEIWNGIHDYDTGKFQQSGVS